MNPVDHRTVVAKASPEKATRTGEPWGQNAKGLKTRRNKRTTSMIVQRRRTHS